MEQKILFSVFLLALLVLGIIFFWWPKYQNLNTLSLNIDEKKTWLQNKEEYFSELNNLSLRLEDYSSEISKIDSILPPTPGIPDLLNFLEKGSSQNGLILEMVDLESISPFKTESKILEIPVALSVSGSYPAFKNFLSNLQKNARLIEVESISFSSPTKGEIFSFDLKIKTYSY